MAKPNFWEYMENHFRTEGAEAAANEAAELVTELPFLSFLLQPEGKDGAAELIAWTATVPSYLESIREAGLEPAPCLMTRVKNARVFMPVRLGVRTLESLEDRPRGDEWDGHPLEMTVTLVVPGEDVSLVEERLGDGALALHARGMTTIGRLAEVLARAGGPQCRTRIHPGERLRDIYGSPRMRETCLRIAKRKNQAVKGQAAKQTAGADE